MPRGLAKIRASWARWLKDYGAEKLFDAILENTQDAQSECIHCGEKIYLDIIDGGGVPDWGTEMGDGNGLDYGCASSPDTDDEGTGGHMPRRRDDA